MPALAKPRTAATESIITKGSIVPTWASVFCLANSGRRLATGQLHVWVVALNLGMVGYNQNDTKVYGARSRPALGGGWPTDQRHAFVWDCRLTLNDGSIRTVATVDLSIVSDVTRPVVTPS